MHFFGREEIKGSSPFLGSNYSNNMQRVSKSDTYRINLLSSLTC